MTISAPDQRTISVTRRREASSLNTERSPRPTQRYSAPIMAAAAAASAWRIRAVSRASWSVEPQSPAVAVTMLIWWPRLAKRASVPAARVSISSGWAWMARMTAMDLRRLRLLDGSVCGYISHDRAGMTR
jgi:hypothetical protein